MNMAKDKSKVSTGNEHIYRLLNFFDLYRMLKEKNLRLSKLRVFEDKNEGIGHIICLQSCDLTRFSFIKKESIENTHNITLNSTYVTSWTKEKDSISLWSLYSKDESAIRIRTSRGKLQNCVKKFTEDKGFNSYNGPMNGTELITTYCEFGDVNYIDFYELHEKLERKIREFDDLMCYKGKNDSEYYSSEEFKSDRNMFYESNLLTGPYFLKDRAYLHEEEFRGVIHCGVRSNRTLEEVREDPFKMLVIGTEKDILPDYIYADIEEDFIEEVCFDPRCPIYKIDVYKDILSEFNLVLSSSKAFGYALDFKDFSSDLMV